MPPPPRRRPVPTTPTTRPRVAGLRKRPGATPVELAGRETDPETDIETAAETAAETDAERTAVEDAPTGVGASEPATEADLAGEPMSAERRAELRAEGERAERRQMEEAGLIGPGLIEPGLGEPGPDEVDVEAEAEEQVVGDDVVAPAPGPRPTGRRKRTGEAVAPSVLTDPKPKHGKSKTAAHTHDDRTDRHGLVLPIALIVLAALLVGLGLWFQSQASGIRYNQALVDSAGTTEVAGQTREAVEKAFSYNFADISATEKAANELLVGKAQCQYNAIFEPVRKLAPEQKLVVTVKVASTGVTSLDDDRATVLLFVDQVALRTTDNQSSGGSAMMRVGARKVDGRWKVDNMEMFGQTGEQAAETAKC